MCVCVCVKRVSERKREKIPLYPNAKANCAYKGVKAGKMLIVIVYLPANSLADPINDRH